MASGDNDNGECRLLGPFALFVQLALGGLALLALVYKRYRERPQRPVKIWFFDVSKQVFGSVLVHIANVFMSMLTSGRFNIKLTPTPARHAAAMLAARALGARADDYTPNPCSFYLLNLAIDVCPLFSPPFRRLESRANCVPSPKTTLGIPILIMLLRVYTSLVALTPLGKPRESIQSGNYGRPPNAWWWLKQSFIYFCGLFGMKFCVLIIFLALPWISRVGDWALRWTEGNEKLQVAFVMMIFPLIMNAMQYYIIDSFIKLKETGEDADSDDGSDTSSEGGGEVYAGVPSGSDGDDESDDEDIIKKTRATAKVSPRIGGVEDREYDPDVDGDSQTVIGSSSSRTRDERGRLLPKELYPHE
jgi:hypothetical protein